MPSEVVDLPELDSLTITVLIDNANDPLSSVATGIPQRGELAGLVAGGRATTLGRDGGLRRNGGVRGDGDAADGPGRVVVFDKFGIACHGFSALATARAGGRSASVLFDAGPYADVWLGNAERLSIDLSSIDAVVLSHWHWDHSGALPAVVAAIADARRRAGRQPVLVNLHPDRPDQRGFMTPAGVFAMFPPEPALEAIAVAGAEIASHASVHPVADLFLVSGDIPRQTSYETGFPGHSSWRHGRMTPDPELHDERFLAARVRGRGVTVLSSCSHAGIVNVGLEARRLTGQPIDLLLGGYHLAGAAVEPRIEPTVRDLVELVEPRLIAPAHCTGWRATTALAVAAGSAGYAPSAVGTRYSLEGV
jgi:7,8-dihydropterin-6-yl-methyl-4-(beta-D-ribofuranosyl)aminobenzene 5'-phosphate synthase